MEILVVADGKTRHLQAKKNEMLMTALLRGGLDLSHPCRGRGKCAKCKVRVLDWDGKEAVPSAPPPKGAQATLACLMKVKRPLAVYAHSKWRRESEGKQRALPISALLRDMPPVDPPCSRSCVHVPAMVADGGGSWWSHLLDTFHGKDRKALNLAMEQLLPVLPQLFSPMGELVTLTRFGSRLIGLESGDAVSKRHGAVALLRDGYALGVLADLCKPGLVSFHWMPVEKRPPAGVLLQLLPALCDKGNVLPSDVTDVVLAAGVPTLHMVSGLPWERESPCSEVPLVMEARLVPASSMGLALSRHAGVWLPPSFSDCDKLDDMLSSLAPYWVPLLAEAEGKSRIEAPTRLVEGDLNTMAGLLGCLLHKKVRKQAERLATRMRSGKA